MGGPDRAELIPGALWADVVDHTLELSRSPTRCWTAVTQGLGRNGQRELVVSIANREGSAFPVGLFHYFVAVDRLAGESRLVAPGAITAFKPPGPFGSGGFIGGVYAPATADHRIPVPPGASRLSSSGMASWTWPAAAAPGGCWPGWGRWPGSFRGRSGRTRRGRRLIRSATPIGACWRRSPV